MLFAVGWKTFEFKKTPRLSCELSSERKSGQRREGGAAGDFTGQHFVLAMEGEENAQNVAGGIQDSVRKVFDFHSEN